MTLPLGRLIAVELGQCDPAAFRDEQGFIDALMAATLASGATVVQQVFHRFNPHGLSGVIVIAESHVAVHTWPEHGYVALDIFTCSERMQSEKIWEGLQPFLKWKTIEIQSIRRQPPG